MWCPLYLPDHTSRTTDHSATRLAFMLGMPGEPSLQAELEGENEEHGDLVQGNFLDTYYNLTYKSVMGHLWVSQFCRSDWGRNCDHLSLCHKEPAKGKKCP